MPKTPMTPLVVDLSHHNVIDDWAKVYASGLRGVIHKATQGAGMVDTTYAPRRKAATAAGLLWGAYHFADNSDVTKQVDNFLAAAKPDAKTLLCLDFEPNGKRTMSLAQAKEFLKLVYDRTGQKPLLYSGNLIKEGLGVKADAFFAGHRLWVCQYGAKAKLPPGWNNYWLWQYTGDGVGNGPHEVPGIASKGIDLNVFGGSDLAAEWVHKPTTEAVALADVASDSLVLGPSTADIIDAGELASRSRKLSLIMQLRKWATVGGVGGTGLTFADVQEQTGQLHDMAQYFKDHAFVLLIVGCVIGVIAAQALIHWTVQDYSAKRYLPSKGD